MKLSIIIPIRNEGDVIAKALDLLSNSIREINYEIVTVNDYSDDNSYKIIDEKKNSDNRIKLFNNNKKGLGGAINLGIEKSTGEAICIMMADMSDEISDLKKYYKLIQLDNINKKNQPIVI